MLTLVPAGAGCRQRGANPRRKETQLKLHQLAVDLALLGGTTLKQEAPAPAAEAAALIGQATLRMTEVRRSKMGGG